MKVLIFDFDGTLADSQNIIIDLYNRHADEFGVRKITSKGEIKALKEGGWLHALQYLKIPKLKIPFIVRAVLTDYRKYIQSIPVVEGVPSVLKQLYEKQITLGILTSNKTENVKQFLKENNIEYFSFIYSESNLFGKSRLINKILKEKRFSKNDVIYIGDETRDIEAAKKSGIKIAAITWGLNAKEALQKEHPDFLIEKPEDLLLLL